MSIVTAIIDVLIGVLSIIGVIVFGLLFIFNKNKSKSNTTNGFKKPLIVSAALFVLSIIVIIGGASLFGEKYPNDSPGTITKEQFDYIQEDMSKEKIKEELGSPKSSDDEINEWDYTIIKDSGPTDRNVNLHFNPDDKLALKMDGGYFYPDKETSSKSKNVDEETEKTNFDYEFSVESVIEDTIGETRNRVDDGVVDTVLEIKANNNLGKKDGGLILIMDLSGPLPLSSKTADREINKDTLEIIKEIEDSTIIDRPIDEYVFFWHLPLSDSSGNEEESKAYKISIKNDAIEKIDFNHISSVELQDISSEYRKMFQ
ncbi:outer membrane protein assembly factor BamE [Viridibacillus arvi]|uniref:outer membrane protein assembly factor BamE domain-containing protein n=1 Tax=Viridibacillus arvi TaxID=263475 RepID=UPI003D2AC6FF